MTEKKQTAVEWLALQLYEKMQMKGDGNIFDDILNKALQMEREQNSAKQKAVEIYQKMYKVKSNSASDITKHFAKQCALIALDEVLEALRQADDFGDYYRFYEQVHSEIEKL